MEGTRLLNQPVMETQKHCRSSGSKTCSYFAVNSVGKPEAY
jgi:hypothetical protein